MKSIGKSEFTSTIVKEYACLPYPEEIGKANCTMELLIDEVDDTYLDLIWDIEYEDGGDDEVVIGIRTDGDDVKKVVDYDGVFELPAEAIKLLNDCGYDTSEVEVEED